MVPAMAGYCLYQHMSAEEMVLFLSHNFSSPWVHGRWHTLPYRHCRKSLAVSHLNKYSSHSSAPLLRSIEVYPQHYVPDLQPAHPGYTETPLPKRVSGRDLQGHLGLRDASEVESLAILGCLLAEWQIPENPAKCDDTFWGWKGQQLCSKLHWPATVSQWAPL